MTRRTKRSISLRVKHLFKVLVITTTEIIQSPSVEYFKREVVINKSPMLCPVCLSVCMSVTFVHCGQTVGRIKMKLGMQVGLNRGHIVLDGNPASPPLKGHPQFSAHICCGQMDAWIKMPLGMELGLDPGDFVLDGNPAPLPKSGRSPPIFGPCLLGPNGWMDQDGTWHEGRSQRRRHCVRWGRSPLPKKGAEPPLKFSAHFYCVQTAACIKMPLGMEVRLSPGDFVLDGNLATAQKGDGAPQILGPCLFWPNGWMDQCPLWPNCWMD